MFLEDSVRQTYLAALKQRLGGKRYLHTRGVEKEAIQLAKQYGIDIKKAQIAALLHDYEKKKGNDLTHGKQAAKSVKRDFDIQDEEILNAIRYHTTGRKGMGNLEKLIYVADLIEENRIFDGVEDLRRIAYEEGLNHAMYACVNHVLQYLKNTGANIDRNSIEAYNDIKKEVGN